MPTHKWSDIKRKRTSEQEAAHEARVAADVAELDRLARLREPTVTDPSNEAPLVPCS
jgi:hypothetical protein